MRLTRNKLRLLVLTLRRHGVKSLPEYLALHRYEDSRETVKQKLALKGIILN